MGRDPRSSFWSGTVNRALCTRQLVVGLTLSVLVSAALGGIAPAWGSMEEPVVAVLDTGITAHPALNWRVTSSGRGVPRGTTLSGYDFVSDTWEANDGQGWDPDPSDPGDGVRDSESSGRCSSGRSSWHGTNVLGTVRKIAPGARILPIRVMGRCGGNSADVAAAVLWAVGEEVPGVPINLTPADVINLSFSGSSPQCSLALQTAIDSAVSRGAVVVAAAGSRGVNTATQTPANCDNVIVVGSTNKDGLRTPKSGFGTQITLSALGGDMTVRAANGILTTTNKGRYRPGKAGYGYYQSSSAATALVSGAVALLTKAYPDDTPTQLRERLLGFVDPLAPGACDQGPDQCGAGNLNIDRLRASIGA